MMQQKPIRRVRHIERLGKKLNGAMNRMDKYIKPPPTLAKRFLILLDITRMKILYEYSIDDYFLYEFYRLKLPDRKAFIGQKRGMEKITRYLNNSDDRVKFTNKSIFNTIFAPYLNRDWLLMPECTFDQFCDFCKKHPGFIKKPLDQTQGRGIQKILIHNTTNLSELYGTLKEEPCLIEEIIIQDSATASFNPSSVNTIRIYSVLVENRVFITDAYLRMGVGDVIVDNFHNGGIGAKIDTDRGVVISQGRNFSGDTYRSNPSTGKPILGFTIPGWTEMRKTVEEAALVVPSVRYVAWDLVVNNKGAVCLIEGNDKGCFNFQQAIDLVGRKSQYENLLGIKI